MGNEAQVNIAIHNQMISTKSGRYPLKFFDGATLARYQVPEKSWEQTYCRHTDLLMECSSIYDAIDFKSGQQVGKKIQGSKFNNFQKMPEEFMVEKAFSDIILSNKELKEKTKPYLGKYDPVFS